KVTEIKSKFVHALHDSLNLVPLRFPEESGLQRLTIRSEGEQIVPEDRDKILGPIAAWSKRVRDVEDYYQKGKITVGTVATLLRRGAIETWTGLAAQPGGIRTCAGDPKERQDALELIREPKGIVVDITALLTCSGLEIRDLVKQAFGKVLIGQSVLDE